MSPEKYHPTANKTTTRNVPNEYKSFFKILLKGLG
jgi:hypothetical protein